MKTSGDKGKRHFSDVRTAEPGFFQRRLKWLGDHKVVVLKPTFYRKYQFWVIAALVLFGIGGFMLNKVLTRAEVADFYPAMCLGEWERVQNAQGKPETFGQDKPVFDASNSASYTGDSARIFCGGFLPTDYSAYGEIKNVGLTLVWQAGEPSPTSSVFPQGVQITTSTVSTTTSTGQESGTENTATSSTEEKSNPPAATSTTSFLRDFKNFAFAVALAQSEGDPAVVVDETTTPPVVNEESSTTIIIAPPIFVPLEPFSSSTEGTSTIEQATQPSPEATAGAASGTEPVQQVITPPAPDENFLKVSYSTDGINWVPIGKVSPANWKNFTITLSLGSWEDLKKLQIRIEGIETSLPAPLPKVLLDGMLLEVHYDVPPTIGSNDANPPPRSTIIQVSPNVTIEVPPRRVVSPVPAPEIVSITKTTDTVHVKIRYFGPFFGQSLNVFMYPAGVPIKRNDAQVGFTFAEVPPGPFIDAVQLFQKDFNGSEKEAEFDIVAPNADPDYGLKTSEMKFGAYDIDIGYFDSQDWLLTPPQNFAWP